MPENHLPVKLPILPVSYFQGRTGNPLAQDNEWKKTTCPECSRPAERETDTMDTFMDSSWYFFRFLDTKNSKLPVAPTKANRGMPVDIYVGGVEHAILHLLYARFVSKFLATTSLWPAGSTVQGEPFKHLITQGMVHGKTYSDPSTGRFLRPDEVDMTTPSAPVIKSNGLRPKTSFEKMSKSKYNGVDPCATIATYGADATRAHMLFQAPVSDVLEWDESKITGVQRWLTRVLKLATAFWYPKPELERFKPHPDIDIRIIPLLQSLRDTGMLRAASVMQNALSPYNIPEEELIEALEPAEAELLHKLHGTITSVTHSYSSTYSLNTVVSDLMTLTNTIWDTPHASDCTPVLKHNATMHLLRMLAPIAPGVAEEAWHTLHDCTNMLIRNLPEHPLCTLTASTGPSIFTFGFPFPDTDTMPLLTPTIQCVVQFDGKRKFDTAIRKVPEHIQSSREDDIKRHVLTELLKTEMGQKFLGAEGAIWATTSEKRCHEVWACVPWGWSVVVAKRGKIVNLVSPGRERRKSKRRKDAEVGKEEDVGS